MLNLIWLLKMAGICFLVIFALVVPASLFRQHASLERSQQDIKKILKAHDSPTESHPHFAGILIFPKENFMLPLLPSWSESSYSAGVFEGSIHTRDLIIAGHNDPSQLRYAYDLQPDDEIQILDENRTLHRYKTVSVETLYPNEYEKLVNSHSSQWDLTLFTCTYDNLARRVIRLVEIMPAG